MTKLPSDDDHNLINFLKQNRPYTPQEKAGFEDELINLVHQKSFFEHKQIEPLVWLFPGIFLFGVLVAINSEQPYGYRFAIRESKTTPSITDNSEELETFLINSWENTIYPNHTTEQVIQKNSDLSFSSVK
ncbi:hypothetical protein Sta7437_3840 [Stanieria cyanosphaera PCC 7437]|uniref:Uncharacterized protein n=1 Tax=Stanieria cyanosphaera (strain ATCC 29371 / PCC 7437) TaxID=111780 RepID=K9XYX0_STAC7|nr:hypothetical protein [Stanieria cyanosphaera]AFZ37326.1 hypothetical protein Sta7437_3840 [Stanieria cyanosphaera PCC 7437]